MSKKKWELKLHEARELRKRGAEMLFDRVVLLVECYEDQDFRDWCESTKTDELEYLDSELSDTAVTFETLRVVIKEFPNRTDWVDYNFRSLIVRVRELQKERRSLSNPNRGRPKGSKDSVRRSTAKREQEKAKEQLILRKQAERERKAEQRRRIDAEQKATEVETEKVFIEKQKTDAEILAKELVMLILRSGNRKLIAQAYRLCKEHGDSVDLRSMWPELQPRNRRPVRRSSVGSV